MFCNLPLYVIKNPKGTYSYAGKIPTSLGEKVKANQSDVAGGRAFWNDDKTKLLTVKFPTFETEQMAIDHAKAHGITCRN